MFEVDLIAPLTAGDYLTHSRMLQQHVAWFGEELVMAITVIPEPATLGRMLLGGLAVLRRKRSA